MTTRTIEVKYLARVEGEGGLKVRVKDGRVHGVELRIFEPPRFFEAFLRGRRLTEAPDITARICGICPVAYQMSSIHAMERALGMTITPQIRALRRLIYCGEWLESHALHVFMLHAPDFLGYPSAIEMAKDHPAIVERGLALKKLGNDLIAAVGGRAVHPINVCVGGFYRAPRRDELAPLVARLELGLKSALETVRFAAALTFPELTRDYELVSLSHPDEYPFNEGRLVSTQGLDIPVWSYEDAFEESQVPHSNALQSAVKGRGSYLVGPLARFALNFDRLHPAARDAALAVGLGPGCRNPFRSIIVRSVEMVQVCQDALLLLASYDPPDPPALPVEPRAGVGQGWSEAPRGLLYHRYAIDSQGSILEAKIVPPTSQNQRAMEEDLAQLVERDLALADDALTHRCEHAIRNYDPCISCATHFLKLERVNE